MESDTSPASSRRESQYTPLAYVTEEPSEMPAWQVGLVCLALAGLWVFVAFGGDTHGARADTPRPAFHVQS